MIFGVGKKSAFQKIVKGNPIIVPCAYTFIILSQSRQAIEDHGSKAMGVMCDGNDMDPFATLRYRIFVKK